MAFVQIAAAADLIQKNSDGITLKLKSGLLKLRVFSPRVIEVIAVPGDAFSTNRSLAVIRAPQPTRWTVKESADQIQLRTAELVVSVNRTNDSVTFADKDGTLILAEKAWGKSFTPTRVGNREAMSSQQTFVFPPDEAVYGLGQHPDAPMNYRGARIHLQQENRIIAVPFLVSSKGYGVLWDNPAVTDVDVGVIDAATLAWNSEVGAAIDYYFVYGPELRDVVAGYRELTGDVPMFPQWSWGFWQSRERYETQKELLGVVNRYRQLGIPLDGIIQDWQYWTNGGWGSHDFDRQRYPDATAMVKAVHAANAHIIISVWARFDLGLANLAELERAGAVYPPVYPNVYPAGKGKWYDPFNPLGKNLYWKFLSEKLLARGFDGWWMDASECELGGNWGEMRDLMTGAGSGAKVFNAYPLEHSAGVYQGQRVETADKRVFILTRSAWAGQQRNATMVWSGDTHGSWEIFQKQIPAGLNFVASGIPYWNTDIGAFFGGDPRDPKYAELFTRWFQFGAFCPMFRVHGTGAAKEVWRFDPSTQSILTNYITLRYHLLPYIYSTAWNVTHDRETMMRPLIMDYRTDTNVLNIADQFLFGPALMACPVTQPTETSRKAYLPAGTWFDFWTGEKFSGRQTINAVAPIQTMPLFVRGGSILPYGPAIQYAMQSSDPMELRIYRGADGKFTLYEDEGDNYNYERGAYATIPINWNETKQTLTIGKRQGKFPGMMRERTFRIVFVSKDHGAGVANTAKPDQQVVYRGSKITVRP